MNKHALKLNVKSEINKFRLMIEGLRSDFSLSHNVNQITYMQYVEAKVLLKHFENEIHQLNNLVDKISGGV